MAEQVSARLRAFLAVRVRDDIEARLVELKRELASTGAAVRWARDDGLHATVKFLGSVAEDVLDAMRAALARALSDFASFDAVVEGLGGFPNLRRPRVLWVGLRGDRFAALSDTVEEAVAGFGFERERRPFRCHITLGRVSGTSGWARLEAMMEPRLSESFGSCAISELIAYRSDLRRGGAVYTKLWAVPLIAHRTIGGEGHGT